MAVFRKRDLLWLLAFPFYLTVGTFRHEGSHILAALAQGRDVFYLTVFPSLQTQTWGSTIIERDGAGTEIVDVSPYFVDAFLFAAFFIILMRVPCRRHWLWINLLILGPMTSVIDTANNYLALVRHEHGDLVPLENLMNPYLFHALCLTIFYYNPFNALVVLNQAMILVDYLIQCLGYHVGTPFNELVIMGTV